MSASKNNLNRRARKTRQKVKALGLKDTLLDLTSLDETEETTFKESEEEKANRLARIAWLEITNGLLQELQANRLHPGQIIGIQGDIFLRDECLNYPLTDAENTLSLLNKGD